MVQQAALRGGGCTRRPNNEGKGVVMSNTEPDHGARAGRRDAAEIQQWLAAYVAKELEVEPDDVDVSLPFEHFALDSATAIGMTGDLESWLGCRIDPTIVYDYPTIREISEYLAEEAAEPSR